MEWFDFIGLKKKKSSFLFSFRPYSSSRVFFLPLALVRLFDLLEDGGRSKESIGARKKKHEKGAKKGVGEREREKKKNEKNSNRSTSKR